MTWSCRYCTFGNKNGALALCELCGMRGKRGPFSQDDNAGDVVDLTNSETDNDRHPEADRCRSTSSVAISKSLHGSRKRKAHPSSDSDPEKNVHHFFTGARSCAQPKLQSTPEKVSNQHPSNGMQPYLKYPHSFSNYLVPQRSPEEAHNDVRNALKKIFKLKRLRNLQPQAVECALQLKSQMIVMATGGGKSLCYQLPACLLGGVTFVISPLLALMKDQTEALNAKGIPAACINSSQTESQNKSILKRLVPSLFEVGTTSKTKKSSAKTTDQMPVPVLIYITPESVQTDRMRNVMKALYSENRLALFGIDEAHCLSSWGHDFRPAYRRLNYLRKNYPKTPCMALTATATPNVIKDITNELSLKKCPLYIGSFDRPNIFYKVKHKDAIDNPIKDLVNSIVKFHNKCSAPETPCSGIVYVHKREDTSMIASAINQAGISASGYHAGLKGADRLAVQDGWTNGSIQVAVATVAFGMGIDKKCVRYVIHWCIPKSIEGFYQESGRAGRDGLPSQSILYYSEDDVRKFKYLIRMQSNSKNEGGDRKAQEISLSRKLSHLEDMEKYCTQLKCRRNTLIQHFGGKEVNCRKSCDVCNNPLKVEKSLRSAKAAKDVRGQRQENGTTCWDGQWQGPHGDCIFDQDSGSRGGESNGLMVGGLRVTGPLEVDPGVADWKPKVAGFVKASDILAKYEAMENRAEKYGSARRGSEYLCAHQRTVNMPAHLIESLNAASATVVTTSANAKMPEKRLSSIDHATNVSDIRKKLAEMKAEREARTKAIQEKNKSNSKPPPPPPNLVFGQKRR